MLDAIVTPAADPLTAQVLPALMPLEGYVRLLAVALLVAVPLDLVRTTFDGNDQLTSGTIIGHSVAAATAAAVAIVGLPLVAHIIMFAQRMVGV